MFSVAVCENYSFSFSLRSLMFVQLKVWLTVLSICAQKLEFPSSEIGFPTWKVRGSLPCIQNWQSAETEATSDGERRNLSDVMQAKRLLGEIQLYANELWCDQSDSHLAIGSKCVRRK